MLAALAAGSAAAAAALSGASPINVHKLSVAEIQGDSVAGSSVRVPDQTGIDAANALITYPGFEEPEVALSPRWNFAFDPAESD